LADRNSAFASRAGLGVEILYAAGLAIFAGLIAYNHFRIISAPAPIELFEGTMLYITGLIAHVQNPYTFAHQPEAMDFYTPFYNIVMAPLVLVFGNTLQLHRLVNGVCIVASSGLLAVAARQMGGRWIDCASVAVIGYGALVFYSTSIASTNALGELLFLISVLLPWLRRWSGPSLIASAACGILAFYTKQYCLLSLAIVSIYLFLNVSKTRAFIYAAGAAGVFALSLVIVHLTSPYFLADTVFVVRNQTRLMNFFGHATQQLLVFSEIYAGLLLLAATWAGAALWSAFRAGRPPSLALRIFPLQAPLLNAPVPYPWICFAISTMAILLSIGQNPGMFMSYLFQLMTPFLLLGLCTAPLLSGRWRALVLLLYLFTLWRVYDILPKDFEVSVQGWQRLHKIVCASRDPLASSMLVWPLVECGKPVHHGGHTGNFVFATLPDFLEPADPSHRPARMWRDYMSRITSGVRDRKFDVLALAVPVPVVWWVKGPGDVDHAIIQRYYRDTEQIPISFSERPGGGRFLVHIWRPKSNSDVERGDGAGTD